MARLPEPPFDLRVWLSGEVDLAEMFWLAVDWQLCQKLAARPTNPRRAHIQMRVDSCVTHLQAPGPSRTCIESHKEQDEEVQDACSLSLARALSLSPSLSFSLFARGVSECEGMRKKITRLLYFLKHQQRSDHSRSQQLSTTGLAII